MFGNEVSDEITREMLLTPGFSLPLNKIALWMVGVRIACSSLFCLTRGKTS